tara:strand:- start:41 stop:385 length:345 start_codon:yes stop_codon:yes gene_type:complete
LNTPKKEEILAASSPWVASLLNFLPGIGTGYIYQRRWLPYFLTSGAVITWAILGLFLQNKNEPSNNEQLIGISGLFLISIVTMIESYLAQKKSMKLINNNGPKNKENKKKSWFK